MNLRAFLVLLFLLPATAAMAQSAMRDAAFDAAITTFERALPSLGDVAFGVDVAAYRDALTLQRFTSRHWGGDIALAVDSRSEASGSCGRFAAFVRIPPEQGVVQLVLCPQFFTPGANSLRELTILHEMVHVVAGRDECQAMAFAALVQQAANGAFTPVEAYWQANGCDGSSYRLP